MSITLKLPKTVHVVKCNKKQIFGTGSSAFCFYDRNQAETVVKHLEKTQNMTIWNTPVNPTKFLLHPNKSALGSPRIQDCHIVSLESNEFFEDMLSRNMSVRIVDNVLQVDPNTCSLSSFCGIDAKQSDEDTRKYLGYLINSDS